MWLIKETDNRIMAIKIPGGLCTRDFYFILSELRLDQSVGIALSLINHIHLFGLCI